MTHSISQGKLDSRGGGGGGVDHDRLAVAKFYNFIECPESALTFCMFRHKLAQYCAF